MLIMFSTFCNLRYPVAIKSPTSTNESEIDAFLEEAKSMLEINAYHENIVNLQGITYKKVGHSPSSIEVNTSINK